MKGVTCEEEECSGEELKEEWGEEEAAEGVGLGWAGRCFGG